MDLEVNLTEAAQFSQVSINTFRKWVHAEKIKPLRKEGRSVYFDLRDVARAVWSKSQTIRKDLDLTQERARHAAAQADKLEYELAAVRRELIPAQVIVDTWSTVFLQYRQQLMAMRNKISEYAAGGIIDTSVSIELSQYIIDTLNDLSQFDPLQSPDDSGNTSGDDNHAATITDDSQRVVRQLPGAQPGDSEQPGKVAD